jgi:Ice-binding-like/Bacterial Ig-like domain
LNDVEKYLMFKEGFMRSIKILFPVFAVLTVVVSACLLIGCGNVTGGGSSGGSSGPRVFSTNPVNDATGVATNRKIAVTFTETMDATTITGESFTLSNETTGVAITSIVAYADRVATLSPEAILSNNTTYEATITTAAKNLAGTAVAAKAWKFMTGASTDTTAPTVETTVPADLATGVDVNSAIIATFGEWMDPATLTGETFTLSNETTGATVECTVQSAGASSGQFGVTFSPTSALTGLNTYEAKIKTAAKDLAGNALASAKIWKFTTGGADTTPPTVVSVVPVNNATGVDTADSVTAAFSEGMKSSTITNGTFILSTEAGVLVTGVVSLSGDKETATFNPTGFLAYSTTYEARVTTGVTDLAGNPLAVAKTWKFRTAAAAGATVDLGMAGSYEVLANVISNTAPSTIEGNIGAGSAGNSITGFTLTPTDDATVFSTSEQVSGKVYKFDYSSPTPGNLTAAVASMDAAYTDASTRPATSSEVGGASADIGGMSLIPGVYSWSGDITMSTDITLTGGANDVWIFQIGGHFVPTANRTVHLGGSAQAKNIFWQTGTYVTLGAGTHIEGIVLANAAITLGAGASVNGKLYSKATVTLATDHLTQP